MQLAPLTTTIRQHAQAWIISISRSSVAIRTFGDDSGTRWRVWKVDTPAARAHLMDSEYQSGWLVFEEQESGDRRRLAQVPDDWETLSIDRLILLCSVAQPSARTGQTGQIATPPPREADEG